MPVGCEAFKRGLRHWASGVTIITSRVGDRIHGMTVSAFAGVSLDPPLVLVCASEESDTHRVIQEGGVFAANLLAVGQEALSERFATEGNEARRFDGVDWKPGATGSPLLAGCLVGLDCRVVGTHAAGDHLIHVGQVEAVHTGKGLPLVYYHGGYHALGPGPHRP